MSTLRISDAPLLPDVDGTEKIPTGGRGDYAISVDQIKDHIFQDVGKELVGLGNVDNTSDLDKPVSTAQQAALNLKADKTYVDTNLDLKADKTNVYTRTETSLALSKKADLVGGVIPSNQLPSYVDDVIEFTTSTLPIVGESGKIYVTTDTNRTWRWSGNQYVEISNGGISDSTLKLQTPRKIAGIDFDGSKNIDIPHNNLADRDVVGAHLAASILSSSGESQQDINDYNGAKWRNKAGGYALNARVMLENGDIVKSTVAENTVDPNVDMTGWVNTSRLGKLVDTRLYGLKVNTGEDQTAAIHAAFAANPESLSFYIPKGVIKANIVYPRLYMRVVGAGLLNTIIEPFDLTKPAVSFNKKSYSGMLDISVQAGQDFTAGSLLDATDVRYMDLQNYDTRKTVKSGEAHKYETILIDNRSIVTEWTGYNKLKNVRGVYGSYGYLSDINKLNSVLLMDGCLFSYNGYFNIKTSGANATMINMDVANGGKLQPVGTYDETQYGGIYFKGNNSVILAAWHEYNAATSPSYSPNNLYIDPDGSTNITHNLSRDTRGSNQVRVYTQSQGQLQDVNTADRSLNDGQGRARPQQLIKNGNFKHWDTTTSRPKGWNGYFSGTWTQETADLPKGYDTGLKIISNVAGNCGIYQTIYYPADLANSYIKDISKWVGREITVSFWVKNIGASESSIRGGISTDATNVYFSSGNYFSATKVGAWTKIISSLKITGDEARISVGVRVAGLAQGMIVAGFSVADDCRVDDSQPKPITEDGGEIFGGLEVRGLLTNNGVQPLFRPTTVTTTGITNATATINTVDKYAGKQVFNNTNSLMYYATGTTPTSPWKSFDSTNTITPA